MSDQKSDYLARFKQECHNYVYYEHRIQSLKDRIMLVELRMQRVYSPRMEKIGQTPTRHEFDMEQAILQKSRLEKLEKYYEDKLAWINGVIDAIPSPAYRSLVLLTYVERENLQEIADEFGVSRQHIYKMRKKFLESVLSDERMQELDKIESTVKPEDDRLKDGI